MDRLSARYTRRLAIVYQRQSTEEQVRRNVGSRRYQQSQREHALEAGWSAGRVREIEDDLGLSGTTAERPGYQDMLRRIQAGEVGGIFVSDLSRVGRDPIQLLVLYKLLTEHDVLLFVDGRLTDPADPNQVFVKQVEALIVARENQMRTENVHRGRLAKARDGRAVTRPPVGYREVVERLGDRIVKTGKWIKDTDPRVRESIQAVFATFERERSLPRTCRALRRDGVMLPSRQGSEISWVDPTIWRVYGFLRHRAYCGTYVYGQRHLRRGATAGAHDRRLIGTVVEVPEHHEGYVTRAEFERNERILQHNKNSPRHSMLGPGDALMQGLVRCKRHRGRRMRVHYPERGASGSRSYQCRCFGDLATGGRPCMTIPGRALESAVVEHALSRLAPPEIKQVRAEWNRRRREWARRTHREDQRLRDERVELERLRRLFLACDPANVEVRVMLETELETRAAEVRRLEAAAKSAATEPQDPFTEEAWSELERLCAEVRTIWEAPTTDAHDRKQLLRMMIDAVVIEWRDRERVVAHIDWADRSQATPIELVRPAHYHRLITEWHAQGLEVAAIVEKLAEMGARTAQGRVWSVDTVRQTLRELARVSWTPGQAQGGDG